MYDLFITNKNYSSWSLRPWALMRELGIPFTERMVPFKPSASAGVGTFGEISPSGRVPCLRDGATIVWDSLAIAEYLAERHPGVWPGDARARAWARCAAAEMHSGFGALRAVCPMSCGVRVRLHAVPEALANELGRLGALWGEGLERFGGPFLAGGAFGAVDAFFVPVSFRIQTYGLTLPGPCLEYAARLRELPSVRRWYEEGLAETWRDADHEVEVGQAGVVVEDLRARA
ncbi:MAG TPA: glutathione S-transferase family protein [Polyangiaceae bacterium]|nr:glutathione S-transferase family protein [Polyangiaceae bacterium]